MTLLAISTSTVFAMGGRSSRSGGSSESGSFVTSSQWSAGGNSGAASAGRPSNVASVPEIDASTGLLAIAAVLAIVAFAWERNRRLNG